MSIHTAIWGFPARDSDCIVLLFRRSKRETWMLMLRGKSSVTLTPGSSFTGYFEPERCDLSADGSRFVYYAIGRDKRIFDSNYKYWTAICKPPFVKALAFFPHRTQEGGGGWFDDSGVIHIDPGGVPAFDPKEDQPVHNWTIEVGREVGPKLSSWGWSDKGDIATKPWAGGTLIRRASASSDKDEFNGGSYSVKLDDEVPLPGVTCADVDRFGRLFTARDSILTVYHSEKRLRQDTGTRFDLSESIAQ